MITKKNHEYFPEVEMSSVGFCHEMLEQALIPSVVTMFVLFDNQP